MEHRSELENRIKLLKEKIDIFKVQSMNINYSLKEIKFYLDRMENKRERMEAELNKNQDKLRHMLKFQLYELRSKKIKEISSNFKIFEDAIVTYKYVFLEYIDEIPPYYKKAIESLETWNMVNNAFKTKLKFFSRSIKELEEEIKLCEMDLEDNDIKEIIEEPVNDIKIENKPPQRKSKLKRNKGVKTKCALFAQDLGFKHGDSINDAMIEKIQPLLRKAGVNTSNACIRSTLNGLGYKKINHNSIPNILK